VIQTAYLSQVTTDGPVSYQLFHQGKDTVYMAEIDFEIEAGSIVDAVAIKNNLIYLQELSSLYLEKILAVQQASLEDMGEGWLSLSPDLLIYNAGEEGLNMALFSDLIPGMKNMKAYTRGDTVSALVLMSKYIPERIRVLLNTSGFEGTLHKEVRITSKKAFALEDRLTGERFVIAANKTLTLQAGDAGVLALLPDESKTSLSRRIHIVGSERLQIESLMRGAAGKASPPAYRGDLEVALHQGSLIIINELPLEEYLYSVVPSEMPIMFGLEPLKAQAVAARSYAVTSIFNSRYKDLGAHVDDSVNSQVYNNVPEDPMAITAVQDTTGLVAFFGSNIIDARYFSTSCGYTANFHEVWHDPQTKEFPSRPIRYLTSLSQLAGMEFDISSEERIRDFFDRSDLNAYDSVSPFFRWEITMTREELEASIEANLEDRFHAQPEFILTKQGSQYVSKEIPAEPLGSLENIRVIQRGEGGNIMELEIAGEKGTYLIRKEYNIRFLLRPKKYLPEGEDIIIHRHDGSTLKNYSILPSAFLYFQINRNDGQIEDVIIRGGGNGHGVGMSQYGAYGMSQRGYTFQEILSHYYPKAELWSIYAW
jgi:stage II sporulation protein D